MCGRKHKFGLNCQVVCDVRGRILDISITCGGALSDVIAFKGSDLKRRLDLGLLDDNLILFGDNANINSRYMVTPYPNTSGGSKDNYKFFHSQLSIRIECSFGMLVQRFGMLRMAMPRNISVGKAITMVTALAKLHNYCIDESDGVVSAPLLQDENNIASNINGSVGLEPNDKAGEVLGAATNTPDELIGGGDHFYDAPCQYHQRLQEDSQRTRLCIHVENTHMIRPSRRGAGWGYDMIN